MHREGGSCDGQAEHWWEVRGAFGRTVEREAKVEEEAEDSEPGFALGDRKPTS